MLHRNILPAGLALCALLFVAGIARGQEPRPTPDRPQKSLADLFKGRKHTDTMVVTGNYLDSRLLAELIQYNTAHPVLLLPADGGDEMYYLRPNGKAVTVETKEFEWILNYVNPKTVLFLGDERFVPQSFHKRVPERFAVCRYDNSDWYKIASSCGQLLDLTKLGEDFRTLRSRIDSEGKVHEPAAVFNRVDADPVKTKATAPESRARARRLSKFFEDYN